MLKIVLILLGLPWNILVLIAIIKEHLYHQPTIILLMNLAISDLLIILFILPFEITIGIAGEFIFGSSDYVRCRTCAVSVLNVMFSLISLFTISMMSFDRFIFFHKPLHYEKMITPTRTVITVLVMWVLITTISILPIFGIGNVVFYKFSASCDLRFSFNNKSFYSFALLIIAFLTIIFLVFFNCWVILIVLKNINAVYHIIKSDKNSQEGNQLNKSISKKRHKKQLHLFRVFGGILLSNFITWLPIIILSIYSFSSSFDNLSVTISIVSALSFLMFDIQVFLHPLVETLFIKEVRSSTEKIAFFCCLKIKKRMM